MTDLPERLTRAAEIATEATRELHILNLGAGVQSTALYLMSLRQDEPEYVPVFDYAIFADTQEEPKAVYEHLQWLKSLGGPPIIEATYGKLGDDLIYGHHELTRSESAKYRPGELVKQAYSIPAFLRTETGDVSIVRRKCTEAYKIQVIGRTIRREIFGLEPGRPLPKGTGITQYFGLSFDEPRRVIKVGTASRSAGWYRALCPLFEMEMTRSHCLEYLNLVVPYRTVPRSACTFCPYHSNTEWRRLRDKDPEGWARACEIDEGIRRPDAACGGDLRGIQYLHRSCVPLRDAPIDTPESRGEQYLFGFAQECEGMCGV